MQRALGIVAAGTGEGKTLVALGLVRALVRASYAVAPFKIGPDYIDARLYELACGARACNLDLFLDGTARVRGELERATQQARAIVIEGMMGLFDGDDDGTSSTAHVLAQNRIAAVLVIDGWRMSQSAAAVALGCASMHPRVEIRGVILNRSGGDAHERAVRRACESVKIPLLATLPYDARWSIPERHLGLDVDRFATIAPILDAVADRLLEQIDLAAFFGEPSAPIDEAQPPSNGPVIAYADDPALWFTYPQTLDALSAVARPVPFSPLTDAALPADTTGIWLGGGYPESHAVALSENTAMRAAIGDAVASGVPVYAECGGLMYLAQNLETTQGRYAMVGALRGETSIAEPRLTIGYRVTRAACDSVMDRRDDVIRGYEFHYARASMLEPAAYEGPGDRGACRENVLASFIHRRFFRGDQTICRFVERCSR